MKSRLPLAAALAVSLAPLARAQEPAPSPSPSAEPPRYREVVEVQGDLPAVSGPALGVTKLALDLSEDMPVQRERGARDASSRASARRAERRARAT